MKKYLVLSFLYFSCATKPVAPVTTNLLFPDGRYKQEVEVEFYREGQKQDFDFNGLIQKDPQEFLFLGYNNFGISLFKIRQKEGGAIEAESSIDQIKRNQEFFTKVFKLVKTILTLEKNDPRLQKNHIRLKVDDIEASVHFSEFNEAGVPEHILVEESGYKVQIQTTSSILGRK